MYGSLSARRAWIEIIDYIIDYVNDASLSARRAWIEIAQDWRVSGRPLVALRKESVDRNARRLALSWAVSVSLSARRAWIEINKAEVVKTSNAESLSARRAWIEISTQCKL